MICTLFEGLSRTPRSLDFVPLENIKLKCTLNTAHNQLSGTVLSSAGLVPLSIDLEECGNCPEFWIKIRALVSTIAFIMCDVDESFLPYEVAEDFADRLFFLIFMRADGRRPGLESLRAAYHSTFVQFATGIQNNNEKLADLIKFTASWEHLWKESIVTFADTDSGKRQRSNVGAAEASLPSAVTRQMSDNAGMLKALQSSFDRLSSSQSGHRSSSKQADDDDDSAPAAKKSKKQKRNDKWKAQSRTVFKKGDKGKGGGGHKKQ